MSQAHDAERLCPSARCEEGAVLLGIVGSDGRIAYLNPRVEIDAAFVEKAHEGRSPEKRFRFASKCVEERCHYWTGSECGVIHRVLEDAPPPTAEDLPRCSIRSDCRWFAQAGADACHACPLVVTNLA